MNNIYAEKTFSMFLLLFACTPAAASNTVLTHTLHVCAIVFVFFAVSYFFVSIVKDRKTTLQSILKGTRFAYVNVAISFLGMVVCYLFDMSLFKFWIFMAVLSILDAIVGITAKGEDRDLKK